MDYIIYSPIVLALCIGIRKYEYLIAGLIASLILNKILPFSLMGQDITTQRVFFVFMVVFLGLYLSQKRFRPEAFENIKILNFCIFFIFLIELYHIAFTELGINIGTAVNTTFNFLLLNIVFVTFILIKSTSLERLFKYLIPLAVIFTMVPFLVEYASSSLVFSSNANVFHTGYRLRADEERNILNIWAATLALALPLTWYWLFNNTSILVKFIGAFSSGVLLYAIVVSFSRAAWLAVIVEVIVAIVMIVLKNNRSGGARLKAMLWVCLVGLLIIVTAMSYGMFILEVALLRLDPIAQGNDASLGGRILAFLNTLESWSEAPVFGHGPEYMHPSGQATENTFLYLLQHYGILGFAAYSIMVGFVAKRVLFYLKNSSNRLSALCAVIFSGYVVIILTNDFFHFSMGTLVLALLVALTSSRNRDPAL